MPRGFETRACHICDDPSNPGGGPPYGCAYCSQPVCPDHRLPENHNCTGENLDDGVDVMAQPANRVKFTDKRLPGSASYEATASPDVALDGSITGTNTDGDGAEKTFFKRLWPF